MSLQEEVAPVSDAPEAGTSLLDNIMAQSRFQPESESYGIARQGVTAFISALLQNEAESVDILAVNPFAGGLFSQFRLPDTLY